MSLLSKFRNNNLLFILSVFAGFIFLFPQPSVIAQNRDHLTAEEVEIVRDVQEIDKRMLVFTKAIERRFLVLDGTDKLTQEQTKQIEKDKEFWGELPAGTNAQLLSDIDKIIDEAINKIEDVSEREVESEIFPVAFYILSDRAKTYIPRLEKFAEASKDRRELSVIDSAVKNCNEIIEASAKIKRPDEKLMNKRSKKIGHTKPPPF